MEILLFLAAWPFLILVCGLLLVSVTDVSLNPASTGVMTIALILLLVYMLFRWASAPKATVPVPPAKQLLELKKSLYMISIAGLMPLFVRYLVHAFDGLLASMLLALVAAFAAVTLGMQVKGNRVLSQGSIVGGLIAIIYLYGRLWELGQGARVIATAAGLVMAIALAVVKFKDKLS
ncbi:MAG: hypothetical protein RLZZ324_641 [Candidatus Parcubacteria bacterium]|jgi:hypothetical protein